MSKKGMVLAVPYLVSDTKDSNGITRFVVGCDEATGKVYFVRTLALANSVVEAKLSNIINSGNSLEEQLETYKYYERKY